MRPDKALSRVLLCVEPVDFRKSIAGLSLIVEQALGLDPFADTLHCFINRRGDKIKILYWERTGFCLWYKRLEEQRFHWPRPTDLADGGDTVTVDGEQLNWLLDGFDLWTNAPHRTLRYGSVG